MHWDVIRFFGEPYQAGSANLALVGGWLPGHVTDTVSTSWGALVFTNGPEISTCRAVSRDADGQIFVTLLGFQRHTPGPGSYVRSLASTIDGATALGASYLAAQPSPGSHFGLGAVGFDGELDPEAQQRFPGHGNVAGIMQSPADRFVWKSEPFTFNGRFSLAAGSPSRLTFQRIQQHLPVGVAEFYIVQSPSSRGVWGEINPESPWRGEDSLLSYDEEHAAMKAWQEREAGHMNPPSDLRAAPKVLSGASAGVPPGLPGFYPGVISGYAPPISVGMSAGDEVVTFAKPIRSRPVGKAILGKKNFQHPTERSKLLSEHVKTVIRNKNLTEPVVQSIQGGVRALPKPEAVAVHRSLVQGGHTPASPQEAAAMLGTALRKHSTFDPGDVKDDIDARIENYTEGAAFLKGIIGVASSQNGDRKKFATLSGQTMDRLKKYLSVPPATAPGVTRTQQKAHAEYKEAFRDTLIYAEKAMAQFEQMGKQIRQSLVNMIRPDRPVQFKLTVAPSVSREASKSAHDAASFLSSIMGYKEGESGILEVTVLNWDRNDPRTSFEPITPGAGIVRLPSWYDACGAIHGFAHLIEAYIAGVRQDSKEYLTYRCGRAPFEDISTMPCGEDMPGEQVRDGGFGLIWPSPGCYYVTQTEGATEILPAACELLYRDPAGLAQLDPNLFQWVVGILRGDLR